MPEDLRKHRRAEIPGVAVRYEGADGTELDAEVRDLSRGGLFARTTTPLAEGKRVSMEIRVPSDPTPISAVGRVVWCRAEAAGETRPAGMGVTFVDVDEGGHEVIRRLIEGRERTVIGVAPEAAPPAAPSREKTVLGVGVAPSDPPPPLAAPPPDGRPPMPTEHGVGPIDSPSADAVVTREKSVMVDVEARPEAKAHDAPVPPDPLTAAKPLAPKPTPAAAKKKTAAPEPPRAIAPLRIVFLLLLIAGAVALFAFRDVVFR